MPVAGGAPARGLRRPGRRRPGILGRDLHEFLWAHWRDQKAVAVAEADPSVPRVCGFVTWRCHLATGAGEIDHNAVDPDLQGAGIGGALHRRALEVFRRKGLAVADVTTGLDAGHAPARRAYEKAGVALALPPVTYYQVLDPERVKRQRPD